MILKCWQFREWQEKVNLVDREEDDTVEYQIKKTWYFNASRSEGLTGNEVLVVPHMLIYAVLAGMIRQRPVLLPQAC